MKTKKFDCVEMKRRGAEKIQEEIAGMTQVQELEYWKKHTEAWKKERSEQNADSADSVASVNEGLS